jgi:hypothetical protein
VRDTQLNHVCVFVCWCVCVGHESVACLLISVAVMHVNTSRAPPFAHLLASPCVALRITSIASHCWAFFYGLVDCGARARVRPCPSWNVFGCHGRNHNHEHIAIYCRERPCVHSMGGRAVCMTVRASLPLYFSPRVDRCVVVWCCPSRAAAHAHTCAQILRRFFEFLAVENDDNLLDCMHDTDTPSIQRQACA